MTLTRLVLGDWSNDGHGRVSSSIVYSNYNYIDIQKAFKKGEEKLGIKLKDFCSEYEDNTIPIDVVRKFIENGFPEDILETEPDPKEFPLYPCSESDFANFYVFICRFGDPDLEIEIVEVNDINIGGYGLFYG